MSQSKQRDQRKPKTSILFEVKQNTQQNINVGQSINIISLNTPSRYKPNVSEGCVNKTQHILNCSNKVPVRRGHHSGKLTIKLSSGSNIMGEDQVKVNSLHTCATLKKTDMNQIIEKFQKRYLITVDKNKVVSELSNFTTICLQFLQKIDGLQLENTDLGLKLKKYESYFRQLKVKETPEVLDALLQPNIKSDKNSQLKILNLERKVETLSYIIKNYRMNNKQQLKQFQKKVHEYKPTIEDELTQMLTETNKKYEQASKQVQYFQKECEKYYKNGNWVEIVRGLQQKDEEISKLEQKIINIEEQNQILLEQNEQFRIYKAEYEALTKQAMETKKKLQQVRQQFQKVNQQKINKESQCYELLALREEMTYKYEALLVLQSKIKQKEEVIKKNSLTINRIQNENFALKTKIGTLVKNSQTQFFGKESGSIDTIQKCSTNIQELTSRFCEQIERIPEVSKELTSFITHLYQKTKNSFQKIVLEYRQQLQEFYVENKQLKNRLNTMINLNRKKYECTQQIVQEVENIENKRKRCEESQSKIEVKETCPSCLSWVLHWGQLNNLYSQLESLFKRLREIE